MRKSSLLLAHPLILAFSRRSTQSISQIRTVVSFHREEQSIQKYTAALDTPLAVGVQQGLVLGVCNGGVQTIVYWTYALAFIYGAWRISVGESAASCNLPFHQPTTLFHTFLLPHTFAPPPPSLSGAMDGGAVLNVFVAALIGGFSAGQAAPVLANFARGRVAGYKLFKVIEREPPIDDASDSGLIPPQGCTGALELKEIEFTYPARLDFQVFRSFSLVVPAGKTVALVGSSGSGKSTAIQLIERFYDPKAGQVLLDGIDIRTLNLKWLRSQIGLVSQEPTLFATTIYENIRMGRPDAADEEVKAAAQVSLTSASRILWWTIDGSPSCASNPFFFPYSLSDLLPFMLSPPLRLPTPPGSSPTFRSSSTLRHVISFSIIMSCHSQSLANLRSLTLVHSQLEDGRARPVVIRRTEAEDCHRSCHSQEPQDHAAGRSHLSAGHSV